MLLQKLPRLPLGMVMDTFSGKLKQIIVDQVDSMETTLAHLFPEMTANISAPVLKPVYLLKSVRGADQILALEGERPFSGARMTSSSKRTGFVGGRKKDVGWKL